MPVIYDELTGKKNKETPGINFLPYILTAIPASALILIFFIFRSNKDFAGSVVQKISFPIRRALGGLFSCTTISVTEFLYIAVALFAVIFIAQTIYLLVKSRYKLKILIKRCMIIALIFLYYYGTFFFLWGFDYYSPTFAEKTGLKTDAFTTEELIAVTQHFADRASKFASEMPRNSSGDCNISVDWLFETYTHIYENVQNDFPVLDNEVYRPKPMALFSGIMSATGFTGVYIAYTGESNINIKAPSFTIPCTIAHELAHQLGVYAEDEANFTGMLACVTSGNSAYIYSGYFGATIHLMNALYAADRDAWSEIYASFSKELLHDWNANNAYWQSMDTPVSDFFSNLYDKYLKSNGQTQGIISYSQCVTLLVNYFSEKLPE